MLEFNNFSCGYGSVLAVDQLNLKVRRGTIHGLIGPNGAGKTSSLMAAMGHVRTLAGRMVLDGQDITQAPAILRSSMGLAIVPEGRRLFRDLSVDENLTVGAYRSDAAASARTREHVYALFPRLAERKKQICGLMSGGEQQMVAFGRALMANPRVLLVDELSLGLMPKAASLFVEVLQKLKAEGVTILLVDQNTDRVLKVADDVTVLVSSQTVFSGTAEACREDTQLFEKFLSTH